jgi:hypothetical protein
VVLLALAVTLAYASSASAAVTQKQAAARAIDALGSDEGDAAVIVFGLPKPLKAGTKITQAGTSKPTTGGTSGLSSKLRSAGVRTVRAPRVLTARSRSYFFYEDRGPFQLYQHPGRVTLVDVATGKVTLSRTITWPPLINGRLPAFLKNANAYRSSKYQAFNRPWSVPGAQQKPRTSNRNLFDQDPFGPGRPLPAMANSKRIAARLAAERSCILRVTDTLPSFWNANELNLTRSYVGTLFEQLERDNPGFIDDRYGARTGETLEEAVDRLTGAGCKDVLLYIAGQGYSSAGEPVIQLGTSVRKGGLIAQQNISATDLRELVSERPGVTFKFKLDAPYAGAMIDRLRDLQNVLLIETASGPGDEAFAFVPAVQNGGNEMVTSTDNPAGLLEFTNCELVGLKAFFDSETEIDRATQAQNEGVSFLVEMLARSQELCRAAKASFASDLGSDPQLYALKRGSGKGTNLPPSADKQDVTVVEDTPKSITLGASDPDGDPLTYTITKQPDHGTLSGSGANRTYTPNADYIGPDDFSFKVEDDNGAQSNTAKVDITVVAGNDAPVLTTSSGSTSFTEDGAAVPIDPALTVSDVDDTQLESATIRISGGLQSGDVLAFTDQAGITGGTYNSGTGVLTLTGTASESDYQTALRSVTFDSSEQNPPTSKTIEFKVNDGEADSAPATKNVAVAPVNDRPVLDPTDAALGYTENDGEKTVDAGITASDVDSTNFVGATVQISSNHHQAEDNLTFDNGSGLGITGSYDDTTGTLTLTGNRPIADYQAALRLVKYVNSSETPSNDTRTVSFQANDGGSPDNLSTVVTRDITVTPVNGPPVANDDSQTVAEDSSSTAVPVLSNDTDEDGDPITIQSASDPAHGTVVLTGGSPGAHTGLTYQPDPDYCNNPPSPAADTFTYTVNGGDTATVSMTVTCSPDNPTANDDSATVAEDSGATNLSVLSNDADPDTGDAIEITNVTDPAHGTTAIVQGSPDQISYTPDANYCNSQSGGSADTFTYTVNGGDTATVSVTVTCVNDAPVANDDSKTVGEDSSGAGNDIDVVANDTDAESDAIEITNVTDPAHGTATIVQGSPDKVNYVPDADYCNTPPGTTLETLTYTVNGGDTATVTVTVTCVDDNPVASDDSATRAEDSGALDVPVLSNDSDAENDAITITNVTQPTNGDVVITGGGTGLTYAPDANYCNSQSGGSADTFTYTVNGGDTATVSMTVTCANDATDAIDDGPAAFGEDSGANAIDVRANDTDADTPFGGSKETVASVTQPTSGTGTAAVTNGGTDVSYTTSSNFCGSTSFTYTLTGGDSATVSVTVNCVDDAPDAVDDTHSPAITEDPGAATAIDVLTNDTDVDGGAKSIDSKTNGLNGATVTITGGGTGIEYTPAPNFCGTDTFTYTLTPGGDSATVSVPVTCVNDAPVVDLNGEGTAGNNVNRTFLETTPGSGNPTTVAPDLDTSDVDDANLESATVALTNEQNAGAESLSIDETLAAARGISVTIAANGDTITLGNSKSKQDYEDVLRTVKYDNTALVLNTTQRTIDFKVNDGDTDSAIATATFTVTPLNTPPSLDLNGTDEGGNNESASYTEGAAAVSIVDSDLDANDADGTNLSSATITLTNHPDGAAESINVDNSAFPSVTVSNNNSHTVTLSGSRPISEYETVLRTAKYVNSSQNPDQTSRSVEFKVNDGTDDSNGPTSTVSVTAVNDAPVNTVNASSPSFNEDTEYTLTASDLQVSDVDASSLQVTLTATNGTISITSPGDLSLTTGDGTDDATVVFTGSISTINSKIASGHFKFKPSANFNGNGASIQITSDDQGATGTGGAQSDTDSLTFSVQPVNDPISIDTVPGQLVVDEDVQGTFSPDTVVTDPDNQPVKVTLSVTNGKLTLGSTAGIAFSAGDGTNDATMTFTGLPSAVTAAMAGLKYTGNQDYFGDDDLSIAVDDETGQPGATDSETVDIDVTPVNDAPNGVNDTIDGANSAIGNTTLIVNQADDGAPSVSHPNKTVSFNVLANDTDVDGPTPRTVKPEDKATTNGGRVVIESDGDITFYPEASASCSDDTDSFTYTVRDAFSPQAEDPTPATVTINLEACVWYVDRDFTGAPDNQGTAAAPFDALESGESNSTANQTVFVQDSAGAYTTASAYTMNSGERLLGEHEGLVVDPDGAGGTYGPDTLQNANGGARPDVTSSNGADVIALNSSAELRGFDIDPASGGGGICGGTACGGQATAGSTIDDVNVTDAAASVGSQPGLELNGTTGTNTVTDFTYSNAGASSAPAGVSLTNAGTVNFAAGDPGDPTKINKTGGPALVASGTDMGSSAFDEVTVAGSSTGGVSLTTTTGATTLGDGIGTDLDLATTGGTAFALTNARAVTVATGGTDTISAVNGPAVDISYTGGNIPNGGSAPTPTFAFDGVDSTDSATDGINLDSLGTGGFSVDSTSDIKGADGISFDLAGGNGTIDYPGTIGDPAGANDGDGDAVRVQNRSGGTATFSGQIDDDTDQNGSITLTNNNSGTPAIIFSGSLKKLATATAGDDMLVASGNTGATMSFTGGGLDVDATTGKGVEATGGGTLTISRDAGTANTIATTTGTALNVDGTQIGNNDLVFESIASNGAVNGIKLNNTTNANGALTVSGNGGTCSSALSCTGGAVQNSTQVGVLLNSVPGGVSFTRSAIIGSGEDGLRATSVGNGASVISSFLSGNGNAADENGLEYVDVTGTSTISGTTVTGSGEHNAQLESTTGTHNIDVIGSTFSSNNTTSGGDGLQISGGNSATVNADVTGSTMQANRDAGIRVISSTGSPTMNVNVVNNDTFGGHPNVVPGAPGVVFATGGGTDLRARVENNDFVDSRGSGLILNPLPESLDAASFEAVVNNNRIGDNDPDSGSGDGIGLWVQSNGSGDNRYDITNNTIKHWQQNAMRLQAGERLTANAATNQPGTTHMRLYGNTMSNPDAGSVDTISLITGVQSAAAATDMCFDLGGSGGAQANAFGGQAGAGTFDLKISERFAGNLWFPGFVGDGTNQTTIENHVRARNTGNPTVLLVDNGISGGAACSAANPPPAVTP